MIYSFLFSASKKKKECKEKQFLTNEKREISTEMHVKYI